MRPSRIHRARPGKGRARSGAPAEAFAEDSPGYAVKTALAFKASVLADPDPLIVGHDPGLGPGGPTRLELWRRVISEGTVIAFDAKGAGRSLEYLIALGTSAIEADRVEMEHEAQILVVHNTPGGEGDTLLSLLETPDALYGFIVRRVDKGGIVFGGEGFCVDHRQRTFGYLINDQVVEQHGGDVETAAAGIRTKAVRPFALFVGASIEGVLTDETRDLGPALTAVAARARAAGATETRYVLTGVDPLVSEIVEDATRPMTPDEREAFLSTHKFTLAESERKAVHLGMLIKAAVLQSVARGSKDPSCSAAMDDDIAKAVVVAFDRSFPEETYAALARDSIRLLKDSWLPPFDPMLVVMHDRGLIKNMLLMASRDDRFEITPIDVRTPGNGPVPVLDPVALMSVELCVEGVSYAKTPDGRVQLSGLHYVAKPGWDRRYGTEAEYLIHLQGRVLLPMLAFVAVVGTRPDGGLARDDSIGLDSEVGKAVSRARAVGVAGLEHRICRLDPSWSSPDSRSPGRGGTHASPRAHDRRAHERFIKKTGRWVTVRQARVGDPARGQVVKSYVVGPPSSPGLPDMIVE
jgi:hypothetical protein